MNVLFELILQLNLTTPARCCYKTAATVTLHKLLYNKSYSPFSQENVAVKARYPAQSRLNLGTLSYSQAANA
ncbi:hypothetical protein SAMN05216332_101591 [Nitrosospira briensis]|nr:hypothetical protein SAMN05216332_101591 [Nitrosospira briensis]